MIKAVLFDVDGTILDAHGFVFSAVKFTLKKHNLKVSEEIIKKGAGRNLFDYYKFILPGEDYMMLANTHALYQVDKHHMIKPYPNVKKVLKKLMEKRIKMAVVSNRQRDSLIKSLKTTGIFDYFEAIVSAEDVENTKPHPDHTLRALKLLRVEAKNAMLVGDTPHDIVSGKKASVKTVGVTHGWFGDEVKNSKPDYVIADIGELLTIISD